MGCFSSPMSKEVVPEYVRKRVLILGVGNVLFGDDGFGPATAEYLLRRCEIPEDVCVMDAGTSAGDLLFNIAISQVKPKKIIVIDAVDVKRKPGEVFELSLDDLPENNLAKFSMHFFPSPRILKELRDQMDIDIVVLACQAERIPDSVSPGLSELVERAVVKAAEMALQFTSKTEDGRQTD